MNAHLMKPVSEVITSPGTTKSFRSEEEPDKEKGFRIVGNLMSAAMLRLHFFFVCPTNKLLGSTASWWNAVAIVQFIYLFIREFSLI